MKRLFLLLFLSFSLMGCDALLQSIDAPQEPQEAQTAPGMIEDSSSPDQGDAEQSSKSGFQYKAYSATRFSALKGKQPVALFFHAPWCPTCRSLEKTINNNVSSLPENAVILKVDYDTELALRKEYGITVQSTVVFFNAQGEQTETVNNPSLVQMKELLSS